MKLDKETLVKQRFWFLLPLVFVLIFFALGSVWSISSEAEGMVRQVENKYRSLKGSGPPVTDKLLQILREERMKAVALRRKLWMEMFNLQNDVVVEDNQPIIRRYLIQWPDVRDFDKFRSYDFGFPFSRDEFPHESFRRHIVTLYDKLLDILPLYDEKTGRGAVRVAPVLRRGAAAGGGDAPGLGPRFGGLEDAAERTTRDMLRALLEPITFGQGNLTNDEIWYALEDVAVRRLILEALREVLDEFALLKPEFVAWGEAEHADALEAGPEKRPSGPAKPGPSRSGGLGFVGGAPAQTKPAEQSALLPSAVTPGESKPAEKPGPARGEPGAVPPTEDTGKASKPEGKPPQEKAAAPRKLIVRQRFYNTVWHYALLGELTEEINKPLPILSRDEGWVLDVRLTAEMDSDGRPRHFFLEIISQNYSPRFDIPAMPVRIWLETARGQRVAVDVADAGSVAKAAAPEKAPARQNTVPVVSKPSERVLEAIPIRMPAAPADSKDARPAGEILILGVQRVAPKDAIDYQRLANAHWIVDVQLQRARDGVGFELVGQIYNRSGRRQIPPAFTVVLSDGTAEITKEIKPVKEPQDAYSAKKFDVSLGILANVPRQIVSIKQILDWQTTPIKRIDVLRIGEGAIAQADRLWTTPLYIYPFHLKAQGQGNILEFSEPIELARRGQAGGGAADPGKPGAPPAGGGTGPGGGPDVAQGNQPGQASGEVSRHGIRLRRYFPADPTDTKTLPDRIAEVRRLPVALVLIVDYPALPDILVALANSPLRIQVTQCVFSRHPPLGPPIVKDGRPADGKPPGGPTADGVDSEVAESNLVELQIYGLASIYENPYLSSEWLGKEGEAGSGGVGPGFDQPAGGRKPPAWDSPGTDSSNRRTPWRSGRSGRP